MKIRWLGILTAVVFLAGGCRAAAPALSESVAEETAAKEEGWALLEESLEAVRLEMEGSLEEKEESLEAAMESVEEAEESLEAVKESLQAMEESLKEAEEAGYAGVTYEQLTGSPAAYQQKKVRFSGRIVRAARSGNTYGQLVLAVNGDTTRQLVCEYDRSKVAPPLEVGDQVQVEGVFTGILQYRLDSGRSEDLPTITAEEFTQILRATLETAAQPQESLSEGEAWVDVESAAAGGEETAPAGAEGTAAVQESTGGTEAAGTESTAAVETAAPYMGGPGMPIPGA